jgi:anti-sigma-K factor RskA
MDYSRPELADRLAADYVAGTLRGPARRRFESLLPAHPLLRAAVRGWQDRLMPLTATLAPQKPPAEVWKRIEARIGAAPAPVVTAPVGWWAGLAVWRGLTGIATVAAISLSVLLAAPDPARPPIVVVLNATGPAAAGAVVPASFVASISGDGRAMVTKPITTVSVSPDRALELWAVPAQGDPRSLGLISGDGTTIVKRGRVLENTAALAVTLEPPSGSPTGKPTGPIVYLGKLQI